MLIMFMLYDDAGFRPTGGWESIHRFNTSCHIEVKNTSFLRVVFKCPSLSLSPPHVHPGVTGKGHKPHTGTGNMKLVNNPEGISNNICGRSNILKRNVTCCGFDCLLTLGNRNLWIKTVADVF
jgi:hypothetical protein